MLWSELVARRMAQLEHCACREYLEGWQVLGLEQKRIPHLPEVSKRLEAANRMEGAAGFRLYALAGVF